MEDEKYKLLKQIHSDASMATFNIEVLLKDLKDKDNKIKPYLQDISNKYKEFESEAKDILNELDVECKDPSILAKLGSSSKINKEVNCDNSDSAIADMMIEGVLMGLNKIEKSLKEYDRELKSKHKKLARDFLKFQNSVIENLKQYL